jgi:large subunit ribosomal protein L31
MTKSTEITYFTDATVNCSNCNSVYTMGMTVEKLTVEICGNCHPFYTGQETLIDTAGRIEKFQARAAQVVDGTDKKSKFKSRKSRQTLADLSTDETKAEETTEKKVAKPKAKKVEEVAVEVKEEITPEISESTPEVETSVVEAVVEETQPTAE